MKADHFDIKKILRRIPILGEGGRSVARLVRQIGRKLRGKDSSGRDPYVFQRALLSDGPDLPVKQITNLLNYTKTSGSIYNAQDFPGAYHSINVPGLSLGGQRKPQDRFSRIPIDFTGKVVLDIGCNQGGMLFAVADKIKRGVGLDYDRRVINAANKIRSYAGYHHLDFFTFDLQKDNLEVIRDLLPERKVDVAFLLAICVYLDNWKQVIDLAREIAQSLVFEANGRPEQQADQVAYLRTRFSTVELLSQESDDRHDRALYFCH